MADKQVIFQCFTCKKNTKCIFNVSNTQISVKSKGVKKIPIVKYCEHCNAPNKINVPDVWDASPLILGKDKGFIGYIDDIPLIQGEKP